MHKNILIIYYCLIMILFTTSWSVFKNINKKTKNIYTFRKPNKRLPKNNNEKNAINNVFDEAGFNITFHKYIRIRLIVFVMFLIFTSITLFQSDKLKVAIGIQISIYFITTPVLAIGKKESPFMIFMKMIKKIHNQKKDIEIYRILIQLKNIAITQKEQAYSADYTINQLIKFSRLTKKALINFLMFYNLGREDEAYNKFTKEINTKMGNEIGIILLKLDKLKPLELIQQIDIIKNRNREKHITRKHRKQNKISDLIYLPIIIPVFVLFLNFIMITIWIPRIENSIFFG